MRQQTIDLHTNPSDEAAWNPPKEAASGCRNTGIHHVGLRATNPASSAEFYRDVLGMKIVGESA
jgi:catechol-2,3-dioxygenase